MISSRRLLVLIEIRRIEIFAKAGKQTKKFVLRDRLDLANTLARETKLVRDLLQSVHLQGDSSVSVSSCPMRYLMS